MYTVAILLVYLTTLNSAEDLNTNKSDCIFNETANITPQDLFRCRIMRDDWNSSEISIYKLNSYFDFQMKLQNKNRRNLYTNYCEFCTIFNKSTVYKSALNISEIEIGCKLFYVYERRRLFQVDVDYYFMYGESYIMSYRKLHQIYF